MTVNLSWLAVLLGLGFGLPQIYGLTHPREFASAMRKFPRSPAWGYGLMLLGTAWFLYYLSQESISDFAAYKNVLFAGFAAVGVGSCIFVRDFLAVRGLAVVLLLLARLMVDTGRPYLSGTPTVLVFQGWAYLLVILGIWLTISPWRLRDWLQWAMATDRRVRVGSGARLAFGLAIALLGFTSYAARP